MRSEQSEFMVCDLAGQQRLRWNVNFPDSHAGRVDVLVFEFSFQFLSFSFLCVIRSFESAKWDRTEQLTRTTRRMQGVGFPTSISNKISSGPEQPWGKKFFLKVLWREHAFARQSLW